MLLGRTPPIRLIFMPLSVSILCPAAVEEVNWKINTDEAVPVRLRVVLMVEFPVIRITLTPELPITFCPSDNDLNVWVGANAAAAAVAARASAATPDKLS